MALILIVDDERLVAKAAAALFRLNGYQAEAAHSGAQTLSRLRDSSPRPDLLILDVAMPEMDGLEVLRRLRADPNLSSLPVMMYSAFGDRERQEQSFQLGAVDYVVKSGNWPELLRRVNVAIQKSLNGVDNKLTVSPGEQSA